MEETALKEIARMNKKYIIVILIILAIALLLVLYFFVIKPRTDKEAYNQGAQIVLNSIMQQAAQCKTIQLNSSGIVLNLFAFECLNQTYFNQT